MALLGANGKPVEKEKKDLAPVTVNWAFVVGVDQFGAPHFIDHEFAYEVKARRVASIDDVYAACAVGGSWEISEADEEGYAVAFLVFQLPDGNITLSPDVFENISPMTIPSGFHIKGALSVLQFQITSREAARMAAPLAASSALSSLGMAVKAQEEAATMEKAKTVITRTRND